MKLIYPACVYQDQESGAYEVEFPDIPDCAAEGDTLAGAIMMGIEAASVKVLDDLEVGKPFPKPSALETVRPENGGFVNLLMLDLNAYSEKTGRQAGKSLKIPKWLNTFAESHHINPSKVLQDALTAIYEKQTGFTAESDQDNIVQMARR